jgi:putative ATP-dependent endonuclease of OLD family
MKLRHLEIQNFRGITNLNLDLGDTTVLIGENNTGKTAVLDAIRFALRDIRSRHGCAFDTYDFHLTQTQSEPSNAQPISIRLTIREDEPNEWTNEQVTRLNRAKIVQINNNCASVILKVGACYDQDLQDYIHSWEFQNLDGVALTGINDSAINLLHNEISYYYLSALRDAAKHFDAKGTFWRPFLKESQLTPENRAEIEAKLAEVNKLIISSHENFAKVVEKLEEVKEVISLNEGDNLVSVDAIPARLFDILAKAQVSLNSGTGVKIPVGRHGEGTQSLAVLTLFSAFLQVWGKGVPLIALEEPEGHLHPSAVRALWQLIEKIPGQKIISTHSGDLLSEVPSENVIRLYHNNGCITSKRMKDVHLTAKEKQKFNYHIRHARGELLFARCWILGEGETEVTLITELARIRKKNLEKNGIRCIDYRQSDISLFIKVADAMGIHWIAIPDNDSQGRPDQEKIRAALNGRREQDLNFPLPEENIEIHLCANGFTEIYENFLTKESRRNIIVEKTDPDYYKQLTKAISKHKIAAIHDVIDKIQSGASVPPTLENAINAAITWVDSNEH